MIAPAVVDADDLTAYQAGDASSLIAAVTTQARRYCGWHVSPVITDDVVTIRGTSDAVLLLPSLNVLSVASVTADGAAVADTEYVVSPVGVRRLWTRWTRDAELTVTFTHGFEDAPDFAQVILARVTRLQDNPNGHGSEAVGGVSVGHAGGVLGVGDWLQGERAVLDLYRLPPRP